MASLVNNFILQTCAAPGTAANCSLIAAPSGRINFSAKFSTGASVFYYLSDGVQAEWGYGTLTTGSPDILSRTTVIGNTAGNTSRLNFAGSTQVYNEVPGENLIYVDNTGVVNLPLTSIVEPSNGTQTLSLTNSGSNGINIKLTGNGGTTPSKTIRVQGGVFQVVNNAGSSAILTLTDSGTLWVNQLNYGTLGQGAPSVITRSAGTKIVLYDALSSSQTDYALGISAGIMWQSVPLSSTSFLWYANTTQIASLSGIGNLAINGNMQVGTGASGGGYVCKAGVLGAFSGNVHNAFWNGTGVNLWIDNTNLGVISVSSDQRYKQDIVALEDNATDRIMNLKPVSYRFRDKGIFVDDGLTREGFVAQDVQSVIPSGVTGDETTESPMSLNVIPIVAVTVKSIQEMKQRLDTMDARLSALEGT